MKKQKKLSLSKKTIANLSSSQMNNHVGGNPTKNCTPTKGNAYTCHGTCQVFSCGGSRCDF